MCNNAFMILIFVAILNMTHCCKNYNLKLNSLKSCNIHNVITIKEYDVKLNENCSISYEGCFSTAGFSKAEFNLDIRKGLFLHKKFLIDLCNLPTNASIPLEPNNFSINCPAGPFNGCEKGQIPAISDIRPLLMLLEGIIIVKMNIDHGFGKNTCYEMEFVLEEL